MHALIFSSLDSKRGSVDIVGVLRKKLRDSQIESLMTNTTVEEFLPINFL